MCWPKARASSGSRAIRGATCICRSACSSIEWTSVRCMTSCSWRLSGMASSYPGSGQALAHFGRWSSAGEEAERPVRHELWLLVHDEVPGARNELQREGVGSRRLLAHDPAGNDPVPLAEEEQRGHLEGNSGAASGKHGDGLTQQKGPVEHLAGACPVPLQAIGEGLDLSFRESIGSGTEGKARQAVRHRSSPHMRKGQRDLVGHPPDLEQVAGISGGPRRQDAECHEPPDPVRMVKTEQKPDPAAPVMPHQIDALEPELVEQREHVLGHRLAVITSVWRVGPTE